MWWSRFCINQTFCQHLNLHATDVDNDVGKSLKQIKKQEITDVQKKINIWTSQTKLINTMKCVSVILFWLISESAVIAQRREYQLHWHTSSSRGKQGFDITNVVAFQCDAEKLHKQNKLLCAPFPRRTISLSGKEVYILDLYWNNHSRKNI